MPELPELPDLPDLPDLLSGATRLFPIIGDPVASTQSPRRLTQTLAGRNRNAVCVPLEVAEGDLASAMAGLTAMRNVDGILVTMPHKHVAVAYCSTVSDRARLVGAVSVIRRDPDGTWHGDMLDGLAFVRAQEMRGARIRDARALLIGAGGAGSAIAHALVENGVAELVVHDADADRADGLVARLSAAGYRPLSVGPPDPHGVDLVFNATPAGLRADDPSPVDPDLLTAAMFVGDVIAGHGVTALLTAAQARGCRTADGHDMVEAVQELMADFLLGPDLATIRA